MQPQSGALLLRVCGACLHEVSALRREVHEALHRMTPPADGAETPTPPPLQVVGDPGLRNREELRSTCWVEDTDLRNLLVSTLEEGRLSVSFSELAKRKEGGVAGLVKGLQNEVKQGHVQALLCEGTAVQADVETVTASLAKLAEETAGDHKSSIIVWPLFRRASSALAEVLIRSCHEERLLPPLELLLEALRAFLSTPDREVQEAGLLVALNDALGQPGQSRSVLELTSSGRIVVTKDAAWEPYPLFPDTEATSPDADGGRASLEQVVEAMSPWLDLVKKVCASSNQGSSAAGCIGTLFGLLGVIRALSKVPEVQLPEVLTAGSIGGAVLWAYDRAIAGPTVRAELQQPQESICALTAAPAPEVVAPCPSPIPTPVAEVEHQQQALPSPSSSNARPAMGVLGDAEALSLGAKPTPTVRVVPPPILAKSEGEPPSIPINEIGDTSEVGTTSLMGTPWCSELDPRGEAQGSDQDLKSETQVLFVECFKEDLMQNRHLLMSQINNLYKMRNGGNTLQYKLAGYDKLHDFLLDIPGLEPQGTGNKMEIKIVDMQLFENFCAEITEGRDLPRFDRPQPVPESFQWRVIEVFRRAGSREIPAKNFRDLWNCFFPTEKLHCKDFGYRDVKGLLANVPMIEKVGSKSSTRYVLKDEVDLNEHESSAPNLGQGMPSLSIDMGEAGGAPGGTAIQPFKVQMGDAPHMSQGGHPAHVGMGDLWHGGPHGNSNMPSQKDSLPSNSQQPGVWDPRRSVGQPQPLQQPPPPQGVPSMAGPQFPPQLGSHLEDQPGGLPPQPRIRQAPGMATNMGLPGPCSLSEGLPPSGPGTRLASLEAAGSPPSNFPYGAAGEVNPSYLRFPRGAQPQQQQQQQSQQQMRPLSPNVFRFDAAQQLPDLQQTHPFPDLQGNTNINVPFSISPNMLGVSQSNDLQQRFGGGLQRHQMMPMNMYGNDSWTAMPGAQQNQELEPDRSSATPWLSRNRDQPPPEACASLPSHSIPAPNAAPSDMSPNSDVQSPNARAAEAFGPFVTDALSPGKQLSALAMAGSMPHPRGLSHGRAAQAAVDDAPAVVVPAGPPPGLGKAGVPPTVPESAPAEDLPATVPETGPLATEESNPDSVAPLSAAEHRRLRRLQKKNPANKTASSFFSSPGAISSEDRDASKCQGKFDMCGLYQAQLRTDRPCMMVDFSNGLILLSNTLCDSLFENLLPLQRRDVVDLIHEDDRLNFSACIMYLSIGKFMVMGPQTLRMLTVHGEQRVIVNGEQMVGSWWWLDVSPVDENCDDAVAPPASAAAAAAAAAAAGISPGSLGTSMGTGELSLSSAAAAAAAREAGLGGGLPSSSSLGSAGLGPAWAPSLRSPSGPPHGWQETLHPW